MTRSESLTDEKGWLLEDDSWEVMRKEDVMDDHADIVRAAVEVQTGLATLMQTVLYGRTMILIDTIGLVFIYCRHKYRYGQRMFKQWALLMVQINQATMVTLMLVAVSIPSR